MMDATPEQLRFMETELPRLEREGAWERTQDGRFVSRMFVVPKGPDKWRLIIDLRWVNTFCKEFPLKFETLKRLRNLSRKNDYMFSMDLQDGYYALGIAEEDRKYFTVNYRGTLWRLAGLPMGWSASPYYFCRLMEQVVRYWRSPAFATDRRSRAPTRKRLRGQKWKGLRMLPFMDDYLFIARNQEEALRVRMFVEGTLERLGLARNPKKGVWEPTQQLEHLGLTVDLQQGVFRAPQEKLEKLRALARGLLGMAARERRWVPVKMLASLAGKAQFLYLAVPAARFYLRELHNVVGTRRSWSSKVKLTPQLLRDLAWWKEVPTQNNGRSIYRPIETSYLHVDSSDFGWGAVINGESTARGFWYESDKLNHITFKELKAVRYAVESFLPQLQGRHVRLHEDNQAVVSVLTHLTTRSSKMMSELRKLWELLDNNDVTLHPRYIRSAANVWADRLSRERDHADWQFNPRHFSYFDKIWGKHTIDRFASMENALLPRYNSRWRDPRTSGVDCLRLSDDDWRQEMNWCNPPWELLDDLVAKLSQSGASATVVAPHWVSADWHQRLLDISDEVVVYPPAKDLFFPGRLGSRAPLGTPGWSVTVARVRGRAGNTR